MNQASRSNLKILIEKSLKIQWANRRAYIMLYFSPLIVLLTLTLFQSLAQRNYHWQNAQPTPYQLSPMPLCHGQGCITLAYAVVGQRQPYMDYVVEHVKKVNKLPNQHVEEWKLNPNEIMEKLELIPNKTQMVLIFCSSRWPISQNFSVPCYADHYHMNFYTILYNITLFYKSPYLANIRDSYPKDRVAMKLKQDVDEAILQFYLNSSMTVKYRDFPSRSSRFINGMNVVAQYGGFFFLIPYMILFVLEVSSLLKEKEDRLRIGLSTVGVTPLQFYISNAIISLMNNLILTLCFCIFGILLNFKFFTQSQLLFDVAVLSGNGFVMSLIGLMIVSIVSDKRTGMTVGYAFVLYSIVMQWMFTGGFLLMFLYQKSNKIWITLVKIFFNLYPSFHYSKLFTDINRKADRHFDSFENRWIEGKQFTYADLFERNSGQTSIIKQEYEMPTPLESLISMLLTSIVQIALIYYFDHVVSSNRGKGSNLLFFLEKSYWFGASRSSTGVSHHRVEVRNVLKCYRKYRFMSSSEDVFALKGASFIVEPNEIVSILGKNGAGKSTMIGILTGLLDMDSGTALVSGMNVETDMDLIRKRMGVCPQFDILWDELTAYEHLKMFAELKKLPRVETEVQNSLKDVLLWQNRHGKIKTFSGGMKRRVSLAISLLGRPQLIILDEPTTGMDPKVRKLTWNIIRSLNRFASIILTTHNMQEADCLSDRIMIMSSGKILAQGTSTSLKAQFGSGYSLRIISQDAQKLQEQLQMKGIRSMIDEQDIVVKSEKDEQLARILQYLENDKSELIREWLISQSSLEQVFLKVNQKY